MYTSLSRKRAEGRVTRARYAVLPQSATHCDIFILKFPTFQTFITDVCYPIPWRFSKLLRGKSIFSVNPKSKFFC